jgi:hypothetical protein
MLLMSDVRTTAAVPAGEREPPWLLRTVVAVAPAEERARGVVGKVDGSSSDEIGLDGFGLPVGACSG